jgi:hypothetical protein
VCNKDIHMNGSGTAVRRLDLVHCFLCIRTFCLSVNSVP